MAEGHSILRWARALRPLVGQPLTDVGVPKRWSERATVLAGQHLSGISTHGKHLLLHLSEGLTIHCHAMMYGSWQFGRPDMQLRKPEDRVRLRLLTEERQAVFFNGPVVELLTPEELRAHERLSALGPDLLQPDFDRDEVWRRLLRSRDRAIGDAILDQRIVAGIGNIFKSEGLFLAAIDPRVPLRELDRSRVERLWDRLIPVMLDNARRSGPIMTLDPALRRGGERYWVYRRRGRRCFRCQGGVEMRRQGEHQRSTYFCASCQKGL